MKASPVSLCMFIVCLSFFGVSMVRAQNDIKMTDEEMISVLTRYEVKEDPSHSFREAVRKYVTAASADKTNIMAEGYDEPEHPSVLWLIERWSTRQALDAMRKAVAFRQIMNLSEDQLNKPAQTFYVKDLEPLSKESWQRRPGKADTPLTILLFVDCLPGTAGRFKEVYHTAMPLFRSEPGVINYQLSQLEDDKARFVTYEKFRNDAAFQYHLGFPPIQPVIDFLNTSIKQQPFQNGLHRLIAFAPDE